VLTVPPWFGHEQREALRAAAERTHLHVHRFVLDALAAAIHLDPRGKTTLGIVDVGARGVSAALIAAERRRVKLLGVHGEAGTGGEEIVEELMAASGIAASGGDRALLRQGCALLAEDLAHAAEISHEIALSNGPRRITAARWELDLLLAPIAEALAHACAATLRDRVVEKAYVAGGMMAHSALRDAVARRWGRVDELPAGAAALGAARAASLLRDGALFIDDGEPHLARTVAPSSLPPGLG